MCNYSNTQVTTSSTERLKPRDPEHTAGSESTDNAEQTTERSPSDIKTIHPKIFYHHITRNHEGTIIENKESSQPIPNDETGVAKTLTDETLLEVLTTKHIRYIWGSADTSTQVKIYSLPLINTLRDVVQYWPNMSLLTHPVCITEPYAVLVHHMDALEKYKNNHPACHSSEYTKLCNDHIDVLLDFLDQTWGDTLRLERQRYQKSPPMATFKNLWMLFKPGQDVYTKARDNRPAIAMIVGSVKYKAEYTEVNGWGVVCDGRKIRPERRCSVIQDFDGEKEISSLEAYPKEFHNDPNYEQELQKRGQRYWEFCEPAYGQYDGTTIAERGQPRTEVST